MQRECASTVQSSYVTTTVNGSRLALQVFIAAQTPGNVGIFSAPSTQVRYCVVLSPQYVWFRKTSKPAFDILTLKYSSEVVGKRTPVIPH